MAFNIKSGGTWKNLPADALKVKVGGAWKTASKAYVKVGGTWKEGYSNFNAASGGTESTVSNYNGTGQTWKVHQFSSGTTTLTVNTAIKDFTYLICAGGGGGGGVGNGDGGGGAGGLLNGTWTAGQLSAGSYSVVVGNAGQNSTWNGLTCSAGGGGANRYGSGGSGGSGGGAGGTGCGGDGFRAGGSGTSGQGNAGGNYNDGGNVGGAGGGGKSGGGGGAPGGSGASGGAGLTSNITGSSLVFSAGGSGSTSDCNQAGGQVPNPTSSFRGRGGHGTQQGAQAGYAVLAYRIA